MSLAIGLFSNRTSFTLSVLLFSSHEANHCVRVHCSRKGSPSPAPWYVRASSISAVGFSVAGAGPMRHFAARQTIVHEQNGFCTCTGDKMPLFSDCPV